MTFDIGNLIQQLLYTMVEALDSQSTTITDQKLRMRFKQFCDIVLVVFVELGHVVTPC